MIRLLFIALFCFSTVACSANDEKHKQLEMYGFKVMVSKDIVKNRAIYHRLVDQVDKELKAITEVVPEFSVNLLRETTKITCLNRLPIDIFLTVRKKLVKRMALNTPMAELFQPARGLI